MDKNNTNTSDQTARTEPANPGIQHEKIGAQEIGQNKYPKFDMGGDNYASNPIIPPADNTTPIQTPPVPSVVEGTVTPSLSGSTGTIAYASLTSRSMSSFIDGLIVGTISIAFNLPTYITQFKVIINTFSAGGIPQMPAGNLALPTNPLYTMYTILSWIGFLIGIIYPVFFIGKKGATPGKKLMKIKVIDKETSQPPGMLKAFLREIIGKFASSVFLFLGYLWAIWDKDKQAWHDKIAGTVVISDRH